MHNVIAVASQLPNEQRWRCKVCGREMAYSQPISLGQMCLVLGAFIEAHAPCGEDQKEVAGE